VKRSDVVKALEVFARLSTITSENIERAPLDVLHNDDWVWLKNSITPLFSQRYRHQMDLRYGRADQNKDLFSLSQKAEVSGNYVGLKAGWLWIVGTHQNKKIYFPVLSRKVRINFRTHKVFSLGDAELSEHINDRDQLRLISQLAGDIITFKEISKKGFGTITKFLTHLNVTLNFDIQISNIHYQLDDDYVNDTPNPLDLRDGELSLILGGAIYIDKDNIQKHTNRNLTNIFNKWQLVDDIENTAFAKLYCKTAAPSLKDSDQKSKHKQTSPLDWIQSEIVTTAHNSPAVSLIGPPGTGKTHTLCETAMSAIGSGQSVLIGAHSDFAVEVIKNRLKEIGGPEPVFFGGGQNNDEFAAHLTETLSSNPSRFMPDKDNQHKYNDFHRSLELLIKKEFYKKDTKDSFAKSPKLTAEEIIKKIKEIETGKNWVRGYRKWSLTRKTNKTWTELLELKESNNIEKLTVELNNKFNSELAETFDTLHELRDREFIENARNLKHLVEENIRNNQKSRIQLTELISAVRASRRKREEILSNLDATKLISATPLWLGTVTDIDDILPQSAAMFDLVILDEASQMDQTWSAGALLRSKRSLICGDPYQLTHVSPINNKAIDLANRYRSTTELSMIDPQGNSTLDSALPASASFTLDSHYRSAPHLIDFSAKRFYRNDLKLVVNNTNNDTLDLIDFVIVDGDQNSNKINTTEIDSIIVHVKNIIDNNDPSVLSLGIITPFQIQADAILEKVLEEFTYEQIESVGLRVSTVHGAQGSEYDEVLISWVLSDSTQNEKSWEYINNKNLFNVMVTRAKNKITVFTSHPNPPGLAGEYYKHSLKGPSVRITRTDDPWINLVSSALKDQGLIPNFKYLVGDETIDIVIRNTKKLVAIFCEPHPEGPRHHIDRYLLLKDHGWNIIHIFEDQWADSLGELAINIASEYKTK